MGAALDHTFLLVGLMEPEGGGCNFAINCAHDWWEDMRILEFDDDLYEWILRPEEFQHGRKAPLVIGLPTEEEICLKGKPMWSGSVLHSLIAQLNATFQMFQQFLHMCCYVASWFGSRRWWLVFMVPHHRDIELCCCLWD